MAAVKRPGHSGRVPQNYFDARLARTYEAKWPELFDPAAIDPAVGFLASLAGSVPFRYVWPSELDLMARLAGMTLRERWGDWQRAPFTGESRSHVSVWQKAP